jgi:hypothetical protein
VAKTRVELVPESIAGSLLWVEKSPEAPYFQTEDGQAWHPIGQNDAVSWEELGPLYRRRNVPAVETYLQRLQSHGVTVMRLMLEYAQVRGRYFETAPGKWSAGMVAYWDDLFALCPKYGIRILLTPFDTFWMWIHFKHHPYNKRLGGTLEHPSQALLCRETREAIKARLRFAAERWGGSGTIFAWDLWNEIHPAQGGMSAEPFVNFIDELSQAVKETELRVHGRAHLQTISVFGPELKLRPEMEMEPAIFRHPALDFATIHIYQHATIDDPRNTVDAALGMGKIVKESLLEITDGRPFLDTEHGPIHTYKDNRRTLSEPFDDEYFRHIQWAHLASGGAGGGMRWPNRSPHKLTDGMRKAQLALSRFMAAIDWTRFNRRNITDKLEIRVAGRVVTRKVARFGCASSDQAIIYLLRTDALCPDGRLDKNAPGLEVSLRTPSLGEGHGRLSMWDTVRGELVSEWTQFIGREHLIKLPALKEDYVVTVRLIEDRHPDSICLCDGLSTLYGCPPTRIR